MNILRYDEWTDTALTLHLVSQMLGKVKLVRMAPQPEWNHIVLYLTADGVTTGLIPNGDRTFAVDMHFREGRVSVTDISGRSSGFSFRSGRSVGEYYEEFHRMLADVTCQTEIHSTPMEMTITTPFHEQTEKREYNNEQAAEFHRMCVFAQNALLEFVAPFRGKKMLPSFFWGTFDTTAILFGGQSRPFTGHGIIERVAFDEQMMEFGFWPGDDAVREPSFFILPYPFLKSDLTGEPIRPDRAVFSREKAEFFLTLRDAFSYPDPKQAVVDFCRSGFAIITSHEKWINLDWLSKPLLAEKHTSASGF
ncbi:MAG: DUF5996 family protein [Planctomycetaceae bacterium]|nr:DUF5996 family protein [Planctomycetaceae bacterium]